MVYISVVVPCYNESILIKKTYNSISKELVKLKKSYEIIFCNDGSKDDTKNKLINIKKSDRNVKIITYDENIGLGNAMRLLFKKAKGKYVIHMDADLSTSPKILFSFLKYLKKYDVVIASRYHKESKIKISLKRIILSRIYNILLRVLFGIKLKDTQSGFVGYKNYVIKKVQFNSNRFDYHVEFVYNILKSNYKFIEIPSTYRHRERDSKFNIFGDGYRTLISTFLLFFKIHRKFDKSKNNKTIIK